MEDCHKKSAREEYTLGGRRGTLMWVPAWFPLLGAVVLGFRTSSAVECPAYPTKISNTRFIIPTI